MNVLKQRGRDENQWSSGDRMLLARLVDCGEQRATDLAADTLLDLSTVSRQVRSLFERGLISRRPDPEDKRGALLAVTAAGRAEVLRFRAQRDRAIAGALAAWPAADRRELVRLLGRLTEALGEAYAAHAPAESPAVAAAARPAPAPPDRTPDEPPPDPDRPHPPAPADPAGSAASAAPHRPRAHDAAAWIKEPTP
ncbi:winged helix-turn-helix transcriptional regulator [Streptomyces sp. KK5PA1]|uniref:Winged helix-turn-helix transcriptional regulator n=2 Tax=Actinacidiphila acididurans TaxID=2784346 RepID=A0ABS2TR64_9ACTN|nr:winged helix-turn-helix transcriptional regulator [Actinacidiphila acididurans]